MSNFDPPNGPGDDPEPPTQPPIRRSGSEKRQRRRVVRIRLDEDEHDRLRDGAASAGQSLSGYVRSRTLGDAGPRARRMPSVDHAALAAAVAALNKIGSNLNQLSRLANSGVTLNPAEMRDVLTSLQLALDAVMERLGRRELEDDLPPGDEP